MSGYLQSTLKDLAAHNSQMKRQGGMRMIASLSLRVWMAVHSGGVGASIFPVDSFAEEKRIKQDLEDKVKTPSLSLLPSIFYHNHVVIRS